MISVKKYKEQAEEDKVENLFNEVFAKEIGFKEFQQANKNFEYRIIFDASLQRRQQELYETIEGIEK